AAVCLDDCFDKAQTEAESALGTALVTAVQAGPNLVLFLRRNANAGIAEGGDGFIGFALNRDVYGATLRCVLERVVEQVGKDLAHSGPVHGYFARRAEIRCDGDFLFLSDVLVK